MADSMTVKAPPRHDSLHFPFASHRMLCHNSRPIRVLTCMGSTICCLQWYIDWKHDALTLSAVLRMRLILDLVGMTSRRHRHETTYTWCA